MTSDIPEIVKSPRGDYFAANIALMKIATYNVNGVRAALGKGLVEWVQAGDYDILCLQEVKANEEQVDLAPFAELGYKWAWHSAEKKGYSGVATFWKEGGPAPGASSGPTHVESGCALEVYDCEGRVLRTDFADFSVINCYFPSGSSGDVRQGVKMAFLHDIGSYFARVRAAQPNLVIVGDYNIAHTAMDIHNPKSNKNSSGFLPEERSWMSGFLAGGMVDAFRALNPDTVEYSWWSFRGGARANNKGWRIDYQMVSESMRARLQKAYHLKDDKHSDHCALVVEME